MTETPRRSWRTCLLPGMFWVLVSALDALPVTAQTDETVEESVSASFQALAEQAGGLDWNREVPHIERALRNVWTQNGWNDESDRYAFELTRDVAAIPPWQFTKRLNLFTGRLAQRYHLSKDDEARVKGMIVRELGGFLARNAGAIFERAGEALSARARGEPYTAEQVAEWVKEGAPLQADGERISDRVIAQVETMLGPEGRKVFEQDVRSYRKRMKRFNEMADRWAQGEWQPSDWGLQDDPIQSRGAAGADAGGVVPTDPRGAPKQGREEAIPRWVVHDPSTWLGYVLDFKGRFKLDAGQATTAESIHAELVARANDYIGTHAKQLDAVAPADRATHQAYEPIRALFREMQERLDALPTSGQRGEGQP
jgi:hypothetical protein